MYQYTTPLVILRFAKVDFNSVFVWRVSVQNEDYFSIVREYFKDDANLNPSLHTINVELTQEETASMKPGIVSVQVRALLDSGKVYASKPVDIALKPVQDEEVLVFTTEENDNETQE